MIRDLALVGVVGGEVPAPVGRRLQPRPEPDAVLVLRFSALGDVVLLSPALAALRAAWPRTRIVLATQAAFAPLLSHDPNLTATVALGVGEGAMAYASRLREALAGASNVAVLDLHGKLFSLALRALLPFAWPVVVWHKRDVADTIGVALGTRTWRSDRLHADRYHLAMEVLVGQALPRGALRVWVDPTDDERAGTLLAEAGHDGTRRLVGMAPGARWATKRWPAERFAEVARRALSAGYAVAVQGSEGERALCAEVVALAPGALDLGGQLDVAGLMGFVARCSAFVANDSGPMHLARAAGVPTLAIFGSTDPGMFAWGGHRALFADLPCSPCSFYGRKTCPKGHLRCLSDVSAQSAWVALDALLAAGGCESVGG